MSTFRSKKKQGYIPATPKRPVKQHILPWSTWLDRLPSLAGLNRRDVRNIASLSAGRFHLSTQHTSYVPAIELFRMRKQLRAQAKLKRELLHLRRELISKTQGWLLNTDGSIRCQNEPCMSIASEIERICQTLYVFDSLNVNIEVALRELHNRVDSNV